MDSKQIEQKNASTAEYLVLRKGCTCNWKKFYNETLYKGTIRLPMSPFLLGRKKLNGGRVEITTIGFNHNLGKSTEVLVCESGAMPEMAEVNSPNRACSKYYIFLKSFFKLKKVRYSKSLIL